MEVIGPGQSALPVEVIQLIVSHTPSITKRHARLVSKAFCAAATPEVFRHVQVRPHNYMGFKMVAERPRLRKHVRHVTCRYDTCEPIHHHYNFFAALPLIRRFAGLKILDLRFRRLPDFTPPFYIPPNGMGALRYSIRHWIMLVVFSCILGDRVLKPNQNLRGAPVADFGLLQFLVTTIGLTDEPFWAFLREESPRIFLEQLSITNVGFADPREYYSRTVSVPHVQSSETPGMEHLCNWRTFQQVTSLPSLRGLSLTISPDREGLGRDDEYMEMSTFKPRNGFRFIVNHLPTWLTPTLARNLTVLSLCHDEIWGYRPKFDFRCINPGTSADSGFPHLKVLSLVRYCFSHEWQIEWFASLGNGGLQELYLDECVLLSEACCTVSPSETIAPDTRLTNNDGKEIVISNRGYLPDSWQGGNRSDHWHVYYRSWLSWHHFLVHWRTSMSSLRVFEMGSTTTHCRWSYLKMNEFWLGAPPHLSTVPSGYAFALMKNEMQSKFQDPIFRRHIGMQELRLPLYVNFNPQPLDSANSSSRPWGFLPPGRNSMNWRGGQPLTGNEDMEALAMLRETVRKRAAGVLVQD